MLIFCKSLSSFQAHHHTTCRYYETGDVQERTTSGIPRYINTSLESSKWFAISRYSLPSTACTIPMVIGRFTFDNFTIMRGGGGEFGVVRSWPHNIIIFFAEHMLIEN